MKMGFPFLKKSLNLDCKVDLSSLGFFLKNNKPGPKAVKLVHAQLN